MANYLENKRVENNEVKYCYGDLSFSMESGQGFTKNVEHQELKFDKFNWACCSSTRLREGKAKFHKLYMQFISSYKIFENMQFLQHTQGAESLGFCPMPKIVIVGAGIAGISCARYLSDRTDFCVEIFEANKERYGGRLWSYKIPGYAGRYVELGGMWLHEGQDPCHPLRPVFQCLDVQENDAGDLTSAQCIKKDGRVFTKNDVERLGLLTKKLENLRQKIIEEENSENDISLAQAIEKIRTDDDDSLSNVDHVSEYD
uniref:Amine oxidase domain-containing protein n=1 Tax=Romanomermis culicivorax TaxID=13658 RepID=A0A915HQ54_ROMCU